MSHDVQLVATFRISKAKGRIPAIMLVHGSGPGTRTQLSLMNAFFASHGLAVPTYDKRGCWPGLPPGQVVETSRSK